MKGSGMVTMESKFPVPPRTEAVAHCETGIMSVMSGRCYPPDKKQPVNSYKRNQKCIGKFRTIHVPAY